MAFTADEGLVVALHTVTHVILLAYIFQLATSLLLFADGHFFIDLAPSIQTLPNTTKLGNWSKDGSFDFVNEVVVFVRALDKVGMVGVNAKLDLADECIFVSDVH